MKKSHVRFRNVKSPFWQSHVNFFQRYFYKWKRKDTFVLENLNAFEIEKIFCDEIYHDLEDWSLLFTMT